MESVWSATVDGNTWRAEVTRLGDRRGLLEISRVSDGHVIHTEEVGLSYGAVFGPDMDDVWYWQTVTLEVVDKFTGAQGLANE